MICCFWDFLFTNFVEKSNKPLSIVHNMDIGSKITELRKGKGWSQAALGKAVDTSREIIGRYERNEVRPAVDVAKRIADALDASLDYLVGERTSASYDKKTLRLIEEIDRLEPPVKEKLYFLVNAVIRDTKTQQAYAG